ncbi:hypothetical protein BHE74_00007440 [Ensete ventricosum]|nr:hypothetical protein BHE74_00007440 [Ensete ventricosum]
MKISPGARAGVLPGPRPVVLRHRSHDRRSALPRDSFYSLLGRLRFQRRPAKAAYVSHITCPVLIRRIKWTVDLSRRTDVMTIAERPPLSWAEISPV